MEYASKPDLQAMSPIGNGVKTVSYHDGETTIISTKSADVTGSDTNLNTIASTKNLSAKFKNPQNKQDPAIMYTGQK